jgi:hypothetical protein
MAITPELSKILLISADILFLVLFLVALNLMYTGKRKIKVFFNIIIIIAAAAWLLQIIGKLDTVINTISGLINSILK